MLNTMLLVRWSKVQESQGLEHLKIREGSFLPLFFRYHLFKCDFLSRQSLLQTFVNASKSKHTTHTYPSRSSGIFTYMTAWNYATQRWAVFKTQQLHSIVDISWWNPEFMAYEIWCIWNSQPSQLMLWTWIPWLRWSSCHHFSLIMHHSSNPFSKTWHFKGSTKTQRRERTKKNSQPETWNSRPIYL